MSHVRQAKLIPTYYYYYHLGTELTLVPTS